MSRPLEPAAASHALHGVQIVFSETMEGYVSAAAATFEDGCKDGEAARQTLALHITVTIDDLSSFLQQPGHAGTLAGRVDCPLLGGVCPVQSGTFCLFHDTADLDRKIMYYQMYCTTPSGEPFTLVGKKQVQHTTPFDLWRDTTTLFVNVYRGHIDPQKPAQDLWMTGILNLGVGDFMQVLRRLRATDAQGGTSLRGLAAFGTFFAGKLWDVYGPHMPPTPHQPSRRYPKFTHEGVTDAAVSVHPFNTVDGLGLTLTRFKRAQSKDVVLIVHGLTNSTDMFIMPEHRNLVQYLLDEGFSDVWSLDWRGSSRFPYNLSRSNDNFDDVVLFDHPAAMAELRRHIGSSRVHVIAHCIGAVTMAMAAAARTVQGVTSMVLNSAALTPHVPRWSEFKLAWGPFVSDYLLGIEYFNPAWRRQPAWSIGKLIACVADMLHRECDSPECHMLSVMWGSGRPAVFNHANIAPETHARLGDLFGGTPVHYYRHVHKMVKGGNKALKFEPGNPRYAALPDDYMAHAADIAPPVLLMQGQDNKVFADSNIRCHAAMEKIVPGRHTLRVFPGYGHQDVFMGKNAADDIFPHVVSFLREHSHD